jgi:hypothetical protein
LEQVKGVGADKAVVVSVLGVLPGYPSSLFIVLLLKVLVKDINFAAGVACSVADRVYVYPGSYFFFIHPSCTNTFVAS